jgi:hypothetical protein
MEFLKRVAVYLPVLLAILVMVPRLLSPHFGLFDDGKSMVTAQDLRTGDWSFKFDAGDSRFRPIYWLAFSIPYSLFGAHPFWFFLVNSLGLAISTYCIVQFLINIGRTHFQAWVTGMLFVLASPVIENFYTLSKGEPWQVLFLMISLVVISKYDRQRNHPARIWSVMLVSLFQLAAILSKETAIIIAPLAGAWLLGKYIGIQKQPAKAALVPYIVYFITSCASAATYLIIRSVVVRSAFSTKGYTSLYEFTTSQILAALIRWTGWLIRDFLYVVPLLLAVGIFWIASRKLPKSVLIFNATIWIISWIVVYLPWYFMTEYYMLPATLGVVFLSGAMVTMLRSTLREGDVWKQLTSGGAVLVFLILFFPTLLNNYTSARIQIVQDQINTHMLSYLAGNAPNGTKILVNFRVSNEYIDQMNLQFQAYYHRPDLVVAKLDTIENIPEGYFYLLEPFVLHRPLLTVRMGVDEPSQVTWNKELDAYLITHPQWQLAAEFSEQFQLALLDLPRVLCPIIKTRSFCAASSPLADFRQFSYGWKVYEQK